MHGERNLTYSAAIFFKGGGGGTFLPNFLIAWICSIGAKVVRPPCQRGGGGGGFSAKSHSMSLVTDSCYIVITITTGQPTMFLPGLR